MKKRLHLSRTSKMLAGVCGGFSEYFNIDATLTRILFVILGFSTFSLMIVFYIICWAVMPLDTE